MDLVSVGRSVTLESQSVIFAPLSLGVPRVSDSGENDPERILANNNLQTP